MTATAMFNYVQARLQARHGERPNEETWRLLESSTDLGTYLQRARGTALAPCVQSLTPQADTHSIEQSLRRHWQAYCERVAGWAPSPWYAAVSWTRTLPELPFIVHLARGGSARPWMLHDRNLAPLAMEDAQRRRDALAQSPLGAVAEAVAAQTHPLKAWLDAWEKNWPEGETIHGAENFRRVISQYLQGILTRPQANTGGPELRAPLEKALTAFFRSDAGSIGAVFAHLGLVLLDIERLRGGLVLRALFPRPAERPRWA